MLRTIRQVGVENMERTTVRDCLVGACGAGMDLSLISTLCGRVMGDDDDDRYTCGLGLTVAAEHGHTDVVNALAGTHRANVDAVDIHGWTALMLAARNNHTATVTALAGTHGANVDAVNRDGRTALMLAAAKGHTDTVNALAGTHAIPSIDTMAGRH